MIIKIRLRQRIGDFMQTCPRHSQHFEYFSGTMHSHDILTQFIQHIHSGNHMFLYDNDKTRTESTYLCRTICYGILKLMYPRAEIRQKQNKF